MSSEANNMSSEAIAIIYNIIGIKPDKNQIEQDQEHDYLTVNIARNGKNVIWYLDENYNVAVYTDTLEQLSENEIEEQLC